MKFPRTLWLGGQLWTLERVDEIPKGEVETWQGDCSQSANRIRYLKSTPHNMRDTVWHEIKHAALSVGGQGQHLKRKQEEDIVSSTTPIEIEALLQLGWMQ